MTTFFEALAVVLTASTLVNLQGCLGFDRDLRCKCGPGEWVQIGSLNPLKSCPTDFTSENIGGAQVCWKGSTGCESFSYTAEQSYSAVCGVVQGYMFGSPDAFGHKHSADQTIDDAYVDGISITHGTPRNHLFTYAAAWKITGCPCKGGRDPQAFVGNNYYCGDDVVPPGESWKREWFPDYLFWQAATDCSSVDIDCRDDFRPWFSVDTVGGPTSDPIEVRSCQDQAYDDEAFGISTLEIYIRVDNNNN